MAAGILTATRKNVVIQGKISLKGLARLIELSKRTPNPIIAEIFILGGHVDTEDHDHLKIDYFTNTWLSVEVTVLEPKINMTYDQANKVATIDKTVNIL